MLAGMTTDMTPPEEGQITVEELMLQAVRRDPGNIQQFQTVKLFFDRLDEARRSANKKWQEVGKKFEAFLEEAAPAIARAIKNDPEGARSLLGTTYVRGYSDLTCQFNPTDERLVQWLENEPGGHTMLTYSVEFVDDEADDSDGKWMIFGEDEGYGMFVICKKAANARARHHILSHFERTGEIPPGVEIKLPRPIIVTRWTAEAKSEPRLAAEKARHIVRTHSGGAAPLNPPEEA